MAKKVNMDIDEAVKWYTANRNKYELLSGKVSDIIKEVLDSKNIEYYTISSRTKEIDSFKDKIEKKSYNHFNEIKDFSGIRVITYVESEADKVADIVKEIFEINDSESIDKSKELGVDKVGYRSIHYIAKFTSDRIKLAEFKQFSGLEFEIQVRTILEHAWAEIEHDRNYKYSGVLPDKIQRRFSILAGVLELADREFDNISLNIDSYKNEVTEKTKIGEFNIPINSTSLKQFFIEKMGNIPNVEYSSGDMENSKEIIQELNDMGLNTLEDLNNIIPTNFVEILTKYASKFRWENNLSSIIRDLLIIIYKDKYFEKAWKNHWGLTDKITFKFYAEFGIDIEDLNSIYEKYGVQLE